MWQLGMSKARQLHTNVGTIILRIQEEVTKKPKKPAHAEVIDQLKTQRPLMDTMKLQYETIVTTGQIPNLAPPQPTTSSLLRKKMVYRRSFQSNEEPVGLEGDLAAIKTSLAPLDTNCFCCVRSASITCHLLQRPSRKFDGTDTLAKEKTRYRRASQVGVTNDFRQCSRSGLVEPNMPKIQTTCKQRNCA